MRHNWAVDHCYVQEKKLYLTSVFADVLQLTKDIPVAKKSIVQRKL